MIEDELRQKNQEEYHSPSFLCDCFCTAISFGLFSIHRLRMNKNIFVIPPQRWRKKKRQKGERKRTNRRATANEKKKRRPEK